MLKTVSSGKVETRVQNQAEQGVAMLSAVLKSAITVKVSIQIMDAFVEIRKMIVSVANRLAIKFCVGNVLECKIKKGFNFLKPFTI